jgi:hypothetical protein
MNTTPAVSSAARIFAIASADAAGFPDPSARFTVIVDKPAASATAGCESPRRARAARI